MVFGFLVFFITHALAQTSGCEKSSHTVEHVFLLENKSDFSSNPCELLPPLFETLEEVARYYSWETGYKVNLMIYPQGHIINYANGNAIYIPTLFTKHSDRSLTEAELKTIYAHEYGHHFFYQLLSKDFSEIKDYTHEMGELYPVLIDYFTALKMGANKNEIQRLNKVKKQQSDFIAQLPGRKKALTIIEPYSELYADTVAILFSEDLKAIYKTQRSQDFEKEVLARYRDYSTPFYAENWRVSDAYSLFAPVRFYLGTKLRNLNTMNNSEKGAFLKRLYQAIKIEVQKNWQQNVLNPDKSNENLIQTFENQLSLP